MAQICKQIELTVPDKIGQLADLTDKVKCTGVNILALVAWVQGDVGHLRMITDDNDQACAAIAECADSCESSEVVCVKAANTPGELNDIAHTLADAGIAINMIYASAGDAAVATIVLSTTDNAKAASIL